MVGDQTVGKPIVTNDIETPRDVVVKVLSVNTVIVEWSKVKEGDIFLNKSH